MQAGVFEQKVGGLDAYCQGNSANEIACGKAEEIPRMRGISQG